MTQSKEELLDQLTERFKESQPPTERKRKGANPNRKGEKKPSGELPAMVEEGTRVYNIAEDIRHGVSVREIAEKQQVSEERLKELMSKALLEIHTNAAPTFANYSLIWMARLEEIVQGLWPKMFDSDGNPNDSVIARVQTIARQQADIIAMVNPKGKGSSGGIPDVIETILGDSSLYFEGTRAVNEKYRGGEIEREQDIKDLDDVFSDDAIVIYQPKK